MFKNNIPTLVLIILLVTACSQNQNNIQEDVHYRKLGNMGTYNNRAENMTNDAVPNMDLEQNTNDTPMENNLIQTENEKTNQQELDLGTPAQEVFPLFITDFQARWNAISDEQTGDLYIHDFQQTPNSSQYRATLKDKLTMEVSTKENKQISRINIISTSKTKGELLQMLTSWWQVLLITNPQSELHEIDTIFSEMGIGPNSNFEDLQAVSFSFGGLQYKVTPSTDGILFEAIYPNSSESQSLQGGT
jgi:hypothetical protein